MTTGKSTAVKTGVLLRGRRFQGVLTTEALYPATLRRCEHRHQGKEEAAACAADLLQEWKQKLIEEESADERIN